MDTFGLWIGWEEQHLGDERDELTKMARLFLGIEMKNLANGVVVIPLLEELFLVRFRVSLYQVLELREIRGQEDASWHCGTRER